MKRVLGYILILCLAFTMVPSAVFAEDTVVDNSHLITYEMPGPYDYYIDSDPMQITDEEFYGVWDDTMQRWSSEPYFRYDDFPAMIRVKEAAQAGQYDVAKDELLEYYRSIKDQRVVPYPTTPSKKHYLISKALQKNVYSVNFLAGTSDGSRSILRNETAGEILVRIEKRQKIDPRSNYKGTEKGRC